MTMQNKFQDWAQTEYDQAQPFQQEDFRSFSGWQGPTGIKDLFLMIEGWVKEGKLETAVEYLMNIGCDRNAAERQVSAVRRSIRKNTGRQRNSKNL